MSFPLYLDEDVDIHLAELLKNGGFDVLTTQTARRANRGLSDESQLAFATGEGRAILTHNARDFVRLAQAMANTTSSHAGIVILSDQHSLRRITSAIARIQESYPDGIADYCLYVP